MECPNCDSDEIWDGKCHSCGHIEFVRPRVKNIISISRSFSRKEIESAFKEYVKSHHVDDDRVEVEWERFNKILDKVL